MNEFLPLGPNDWTEGCQDGNGGCYSHICAHCGSKFHGSKSRQFAASCKLCQERMNGYANEAKEMLDKDGLAAMAHGLSVPDDSYRSAFIDGYVRASMTVKSNNSEGERAALAWMRAQASALDPTITIDEMSTSDLARIICEGIERSKL